MRVSRSTRTVRPSRSRRAGTGGGGVALPELIGVNSLDITTAPQAISLPVGALAGDLAIIFAAHNFAFDATSMAGATIVTNTYATTFAKILTAGDITAGTLTFDHLVNADPRGVGLLAVFRGATSAVSSAQVNPAPSSGVAFVMPVPVTNPSLTVLCIDIPSNSATALVLTSGGLDLAVSRYRAGSNGVRAAIYWKVNETGAKLADQTFTAASYGMVSAFEYPTA